MQITSKPIKFSVFIYFIFATIPTPTVSAKNLSLSSAQGGNISLNVQKHGITARNIEKNIDYQIDSAILRHLKRSDDIRLITNKSTQGSQLFIVLARESSRPDAMGRGYCGAGYEDHLLLIEIAHRKLTLRDHLLLQSCLKSISMFIDHGDDNPSNGLIHEKDGALSYRLVDDDYDKKRLLTIDARHFKVTLSAPTSQ